MKEWIMKGMLKWPLLLAAAVVVLRVILEQLEAPAAITNVLSVVVLYVIVIPIYFAIRIANSGIARPYRTQLKYTALYAALARCIVIPTYWLAYIFQWTAPRFSVDQGGVVGPGVTPLTGFVFVPLAALVVWVIASLIVGGGIGSLIIALKRKSSRAPAATHS
jgi:hypothetical protein